MSVRSKIGNLASFLFQGVKAFLARISVRGWARLAAGFLVLLALYYVGGALVLHRIDDNPDFTPLVVTEKGSAAIDVAAALIGREVDDHAWVANDPFFVPGALLDNMPNYQQGIVYALGRFAVQMADQLGRARGSSQVDPDLDRAVGFLKYPGNVWVFDLRQSLVPTASSERQYRRAREALLSYNKRVAEGMAVFDRRADNLIAVLDSIAADLGSQSAVIDHHLEHPALLDFQADDTFYATKGRLYAYFLLMEGLGKDYEQIIRDRDLATVWDNMQNSFRQAIAMRPLVVINGAPDSQFLPSHLAGLGFYLMRVRMQLREITNILAK